MTDALDLVTSLLNDDAQNALLSLDGLVVEELVRTNKRLRVRVANRYDAMIAAKTLRSEGYHGICKKEPSGSYTVDIRLSPIG